MVKHRPDKLTNKLNTREESFLANFLFISQLARDLTHSLREILIPVFTPEKLTFSHCLTTKKCSQKFPDLRRREFRVFRNLSSSV